MPNYKEYDGRDVFIKILRDICCVNTVKDVRRLSTELIHCWPVITPVMDSYHFFI